MCRPGLPFGETNGPVADPGKDGESLASAHTNPAGLNVVLDRTTQIRVQTAEPEPPGKDAPRVEEKRRGPVRRVANAVWGFFVRQSFSSLTRRIVILNLAGLVTLVTGVLYLSQFRAGLI